MMGGGSSVTVDPFVALMQIVGDPKATLERTAKLQELSKEIDDKMASLDARTAELQGAIAKLDETKRINDEAVVLLDEREATVLKAEARAAERGAALDAREDRILAADKEIAAARRTFKVEEEQARLSISIALEGLKVREAELNDQASALEAIAQGLDERESAIAAGEKSLAERKEALRSLIATD